MITHRHHIIPRHTGGSDDQSNLVTLTIHEHAEAHKKLFEEHGRWQDEVAWRQLSGQIDCAEALKEAQVKSNKGKQRKLGYITPEETKRKISQKLKGRKHSEEHRKNNSASHKGYKQSAEHTRKIVESRKRNKNAIIR
ncbi:MAG: HNH endonuclease [Proteobacteria bacterium]|nr:HNH endonuclease [Pseudomonadota bacterium]